jgi:hypothetical protein
VLRGALDLDDATVLAHDDIHVDAGAYVLIVIQIETGLTVDDPDAHGGNPLPHRRLGNQPLANHPVECVDNRYRGSGDRGSASPTVRLEYIAVDADGVLAEPEARKHGAHASPDESLDLLGPPSELCALP